MSKDLVKLLNWKLLKGSHKFPGPDGGTCINEAAIIVAGFPYREVSSVEDLPPCFSRPISAFALKLNDFLPDQERQKLIPYVVRLSGSADTPEVEQERAWAIVLGVIHKVVAPAFRSIGLENHASALAVCTKKTAANAAYAAYAAANVAYATANAANAAYAAAKAAYAAAKAAYAADKAAYANVAYAAANAANAAYVDDLLSILSEALAIGKQAEPIETAVIIQRAEAAKALVRV